MGVEEDVHARGAGRLSLNLESPLREPMEGEGVFPSFFLLPVVWTPYLPDAHKRTLFLVHAPQRIICTFPMWAHRVGSR